MNGFHVYILYMAGDLKLVSSNFKALYVTLKNNQKEIGIKKMQAYSTLIKKARNFEPIIFELNYGSDWKIQRQDVICKPLTINPTLKK